MIVFPFFLFRKEKTFSGITRKCRTTNSHSLNPLAVLDELRQGLGVDYLGPAAEFPCSFPVNGKICGNNKRLMVSLSCRREGKKSKAINIIFLIDTGSPNTFLSDKAMEALVGKPGCNIGSTMDVSIQSLKNIECHISPHDKHFADVNVLGADFLVKNGLALKANYSSDICTLMVEENE